MDQPNNKAVVRAFFDVYYTHNYNSLSDYVSHDYIDHTLPQVRSLRDAISVLERTHIAFPDIQVEIHDLIEEGDRVVFRGQFTATHRGDFCGHPPTGLQISFEAIEIFQLKDHKIIASWGYWPTDEIMRQIHSC